MGEVIGLGKARKARDRAEDKRRAEENRIRSPVVSSVRLSFTRGWRTGTAPAAVVTSRSAW